MLLFLHSMQNCELPNQCGVFKHRGCVGNMSCVYTKPFGTQLPSPVQIYFLSIILLYEPHLGESTLTEAKADPWCQGEKQRGVWVPQSEAQRKTFPSV